jgi:predicted PurR-regulated permease PerM
MPASLPDPMRPPESARGPARPAALALAFATAIVGLWFVYHAMTAIMLLFLALVTSIALSAAVRWMRRRGLPRWLAVAITLILFLAAFAVFFVVIVPPLVKQVTEFVPEIPRFLGRAVDQLSSKLGDYPQLQQALQGSTASPGQFPSVLDVIGRLGGASLSLLGFATLLILYLSAVLYITSDPLPLMRGYLAALPVRHRAAGIRAYRGASRAVVGWIRANIIVGPIEAVASGIFLSLMHVPGAIVWAALAFFAEFVPRIGGYIMAIPPIVLALSVDLPTAMWTALFYLVLTESLGTFLSPVVRGRTMRIHPAVLLFATLASALAFGLLGALVGTPAAAFAVAYYREFYLKLPPPAPRR